MQIIRDAETLRREIAALRAGGGTIAFVPTMGALHAGHMALVAEARSRADHVVASIFVNPTQFGPNEDLSTYPRREATDAAMLEEAGVAILWGPDAAAMYPEGFATTVTVGGVGEELEGVARPGHFDGVATVVAKLFGQVRPDIALFGQKDFQQLAVIRRMTRDLDLAIDIVAVATMRDGDGLALSSRNAYLSEEEREAALALPRALGEAAKAISGGAPVAGALDNARARLADAGFGPIDYVAFCDPDTLQPLATADRPGRLLAAAFIGTTRLIDNLAVDAPAIR
ncbi:MAG TPA: pantoate--beta-alanine ligase [Allosphingosinicella sp.]